MANLLWYNEGLFVDLPHGYVDDLTQVYDSSGTIKADYFEKISGEHSKNGIYRVYLRRVRIWKSTINTLVL